MSLLMSSISVRPVDFYKSVAPPALRQGGRIPRFNHDQGVCRRVTLCRGISHILPHFILVEPDRVRVFSEEFVDRYSVNGRWPGNPFLFSVEENRHKVFPSSSFRGFFRGSEFSLGLGHRESFAGGIGMSMGARCKTLVFPNIRRNATRPGSSLFKVQFGCDGWHLWIWIVSSHNHLFIDSRRDAHYHRIWLGGINSARKIRLLGHRRTICADRNNRHCTPSRRRNEEVK